MKKVKDNETATEAAGQNENGFAAAAAQRFEKVKAALDQERKQQAALAEQLRQCDQRILQLTGIIYEYEQFINPILLAPVMPAEEQNKATE